MYTLTYFIFLVLQLLSASDISQSRNAPIYHLSEPDQVMVLHSDLEEISGLSYYDGKLYAVQDEIGSVYILNPATGKILEEKRCWKNGDYEAIEVVDNYVYILKSNGNIYRSPLNDICEDKTEKIDLGFDSDWNFEGMCYDPFKENLMIVAKRSQIANRNEVYCLPIGDIKKLGSPCYVINEDEIKEKLANNDDSWSEKMVQKVSYSFNPSGIAVHPQNGDIYILSSPAKQLLQLTKNWEIKKILKLNSDLYNQPEGICFDSKLNLYIGNEAKKGKPKILKFHPK